MPSAAEGIKLWDDLKFNVYESDAGFKFLLIGMHNDDVHRVNQSGFSDDEIKALNKMNQCADEIIKELKKFVKDFWIKHPESQYREGNIPPI